jgi:cob(I)alamin adenosyltransferase
VCRRAERRVVTLAQVEAVSSVVLRLLNRLSDLLFVMARATNTRAGVEETPWVGRERRS